MPRNTFNIYDSGAILARDILTSLTGKIRGDKEKLKTNVYRVTCNFKSRINSHSHLKVLFPFQKQCYRRNELDFWVWDDELAT